jgi:hypothetical protein
LVGVRVIEGRGDAGGDDDLDAMFGPLNKK